MTGKELWAQYQHYTRDFTEHSRKLAFAGAAICWFFRDAEFRFPTYIYASLLCIVLFFLADIFHSLGGALMVRLFTESRERKMWAENHTIEGDILKPKWVDAPAFFAFGLKGIFLITGFVFIGLELFQRIQSRI